MRLRHVNAYRMPSALEALAVDIMIYDIYIYYDQFSITRLLLTVDVLRM